MPAKTTAEFVADSISVHGDHYAYDLVRYVNAKTKVKIICPVHGQFEQLPTNHLKGRGCSKCRYVKNSSKFRKPKEKWISEFRKVHGEKYDYRALPEDILGTSKVTINCLSCGQAFMQTPASHRNGNGCPKCALTARNMGSRRTRNERTDQFRKIHGENYDYSRIGDDVRVSAKIEIGCRRCGEYFKQYVANHLNGKGCRKCSYTQRGESKVLGKDEVLSRFNDVHGQAYDYSKIGDDVAAKTKIQILCLSCDAEFTQTVDHHQRGQGCPACRDTGFDPSKRAILYYLAVSGENEEKLYKVGITNRSVEDRFSGRDLTRIRVIKRWHFRTGREAQAKEQELLKRYSRYRYHGKPILTLGGNTELFDRDILELDGSDE